MVHNDGDISTTTGTTNTTTNSSTDSPRTTTTTSTSLQLSLPESFDDGFSFEPASNNIIPNSQSSKEAHQLYAQLLQSRNALSTFENEVKDERRELILLHMDTSRGGGDGKMDALLMEREEYDRLVLVPKDHLSVSQLARLIIHELMQKKEKEFQLVKEELTSTLEATKSQLGQAESSSKLAQEESTILSTQLQEQKEQHDTLQQEMINFRQKSENNVEQMKRVHQQENDKWKETNETITRQYQNATSEIDTLREKLRQLDIAAERTRSSLKVSLSEKSITNTHLNERIQSLESELQSSQQKVQFLESDLQTVKSESKTHQENALSERKRLLDEIVQLSKENIPIELEKQKSKWEEYRRIEEGKFNQHLHKKEELVRRHLVNQVEQNEKDHASVMKESRAKYKKMESQLKKILTEVEKKEREMKQQEMENQSSLSQKIAELELKERMAREEFEHSVQFEKTKFDVFVTESEHKLQKEKTEKDKIHKEKEEFRIAAHKLAKLVRQQRQKAETSEPNHT